MKEEIIYEILELILIIFVMFALLALCDVGNKKAIHEQAIYEAQFNYNFEIPTGFEDAIINSN